MLLSQVINIIGLMATFFKASRQLSQGKHTAGKFLMSWPHISTRTTSPKRSPNSHIKFKGIQMRVSPVNQEKPELHCPPPPPSMPLYKEAAGRLVIKCSKNVWARMGGLAFNSWHPPCPGLQPLSPRRVRTKLQHIGITAKGGT